ncbi:PadR family transcriptional regulator [Subdoligranulum variabile]|uniref:PadR family transcriptional regulator n=3 Tax=Subdoligranulum variabile TaxID=214851 RepID=UPI0026EEB3A3|nr:PadR family transcriptional regulator [Subdoligranulum variabile]
MKPEKKTKNDPAQGMRDAMKKATTEMLVLFMLRQKPMYTYQMAQEVDRLTQGVLAYNTMYLAVYRLQEGGYIQETEKRIEDGRARIYLGITPAGQAYYEQLRAEYGIFTAALEGLMARDGALYPEGTEDV